MSVEGPGIDESFMEPAPGYDPHMPHDLAHFIVEDEFGVSGGVFGQLAAGGLASTFRPVNLATSNRKAKTGQRISIANRQDALLSERLVDLVQKRWLKSNEPAVAVEGVTNDAIDRACKRFEDVSAQWAKLRPGEGLTFVWQGGKAQPPRRKRR